MFVAWDDVIIQFVPAESTETCVKQQTVMT